MIAALMTRMRACGPVALARAARRCGIELSVAEAARRAQAGPGGATLLGLKAAGESSGLACSALRTNYAGLTRLAKPVIAHFAHGHFALVESADAGGVRLTGVWPRRLRRREFEELWSGAVLTVNPRRDREDRILKEERHEAE